MKKDNFIIFLDIDGVLNNYNYWYECAKRHNNKKLMNCQNFPFDPKCLENLMKLYQKIEEKYTPQIVLTSTWRLSMVDTAIVNSRLAEYGMEIINKTDDLGGCRDNEIENFLLKLKLNNTSYANYLILDDNIWGFKQKFDDRNIIETNAQTGFNNEKLEEAIEKIDG